MLHEFVSSVQSAQSKLSALCTCVEDYVEKLLFLDEYLSKEKAMDYACSQVCWSLQQFGQIRHVLNLTLCQHWLASRPNMLGSHFSGHSILCNLCQCVVALTLNCPAWLQVHDFYALLDEYHIKVGG